MVPVLAKVRSISTSVVLPRMLVGWLPSVECSERSLISDRDAKEFACLSYIS